MSKVGIALLSVLVISGCSKTSTEIVKASYSAFDDKVSVGSALDKRKLCNSVEWNEFETLAGERIVEYKCHLKGANQYLQTVHDLQPELMKEKQFYRRYQDIERHYQWHLDIPKYVPQKIAKWELERQGAEDKIADIQVEMESLHPESLAYQYKIERIERYQTYINELNQKIGEETQLLAKFSEQAVMKRYYAAVEKMDRKIASLIDDKFGDYDFIDATQRFQWTMSSDDLPVLKHSSIDFVSSSGKVFERSLSKDEALKEAFANDISSIEQNTYVKTYLEKLGYQDI
ncbi:hypothetical protein [Vibrio taketomensis]|uniref:hypothetical protein n=1 Tax=Vibrio taketomensis TaxID=2572923 RepID=UPI00138A1A98|nr:hypothetical protein [Vibrio taketomensis]